MRFDPDNNVVHRVAFLVLIFGFLVGVIAVAGYAINQSPSDPVGPRPTGCEHIMCL